MDKLLPFLCDGNYDAPKVNDVFRLVNVSSADLISLLH